MTASPSSRFYFVVERTDTCICDGEWETQKKNLISVKKKKSNMRECVGEKRLNSDPASRSHYRA